ncbi:MAG: Rrf2 family transcriptional regulator [Clostridiales bacterium]|nr:Rrf2 family transcriptional regulator [Clostridiales bacterium]
MHITLESDYAVRIVACLAAEGIRIDAKTISEITCVTLRFSLKILRKLVTAGIVKSFKGAQGGYQLAKEPSEISLKDVIETIEGTYNFNRCLDTDFCSRGKSGMCAYQQVFNNITQMVSKQLEEHNFENCKDIQKDIDKKSNICCETRVI